MRAPAALDLCTLLAGYRRGDFTPTEIAGAVLERLERGPERNVWIARLPGDEILARARVLEALPAALPLFGVPFAIKDNIDLAGVPTTAACPAYAYLPAASAPVVDRLLAAGAIAIGKTNLDQFATGLVGTRSPYGACRNPFDGEFISGGSSSGSAVAVASGLVSFALGTDTAGSGRVPAGFNNLVGLKPTRGRLSARGVVPACQSLDCVSIFALTAGDASRVLDAAEGFDPEDPYARRNPGPAADLDPGAFRFGVPRPEQLEFFGDDAYGRLFEQAIARAEAIGGRRVEIDLEPFLAAARLLYEGPWLAERFAAVGQFVVAHPGACHPVTREVVAAGALPTAADAFRAGHQLMAIRRATEAAWDAVDLLLTPTAGTIHRVADVEAEPLRRNAELGRYTNFVNLLDLAAVAVPAGFRPDGLPFGVTLAAPAWSDRELLAVAHRLHRASGVPLGALGAPQPEDGGPSPAMAPERIAVAVCGAHLTGLPLAHQLVSRGGRLLSRARTAPWYRFYALAGGPPARPGLVRVERDGASIEVEVWSLPADRFGGFVAEIPSPLSIGKVELEDGSRVSGFLCEPAGLAGAMDITACGGWRRYLEERARRG